MGWLTDLWHIIKPTDAIAFWTFVLCILVAWGLRSLSLAKKDAVTRATREARAIAIERGREFAEMIVSNNENIAALSAAKIAPFKAANEVEFGEGEAALLAAARQWAGAIPRDVGLQTVKLLNGLEAWAMYFTCGVADHEAIRAPCAPQLCFFVMQYFGLLVALRSQSTSGRFPNLVSLYSDWSVKLRAEQLGLRQEDVNTQLRELAARHRPLPPPIGT